MIDIYCAWCGALRTDSDSPCPSCGRTGTTMTTPSQEPCAYCGARPTWPVTWESDGKKSTLYLCAECDEAETNELQPENCG